jgi:hypothetical protein
MTGGDAAATLDYIDNAHITSTAGPKVRVWGSESSPRDVADRRAGISSSLLFPRSREANRAPAPLARPNDLLANTLITC